MTEQSLRKSTCLPCLPSQGLAHGKEDPRQQPDMTVAEEWGSFKRTTVVNKRAQALA